MNVYAKNREQWYKSCGFTSEEDYEAWRKSIGLKPEKEHKLEWLFELYNEGVLTYERVQRYITKHNLADV